MAYDQRTKYGESSPQEDKSPAVRVHESSSISTATDFTYVGIATAGTQDSDDCWRILRLEESGSLTILKQADGNDYFDNVWDDRLTLTYL